jgi:hypothetical protein
VDLPQFTVIVDTTGYSFSVTSGENNQFVIVDDKATEISSEICNVRNDTLFINCSPRYGLTIVCKEVKAIIVKNAEWLYITDLSSEALYLKLEKVHSAINNLKVGTFNFDVSNETRCDANNIEVETLTGKLSNSRFNIYSSKIRRSSIEQLDEKNQNMIIY